MSKKAGSHQLSMLTEFQAQKNGKGCAIHWMMCCTDCNWRCTGEVAGPVHQIGIPS